MPAFAEAATDAKRTFFTRQDLELLVDWLREGGGSRNRGKHFDNRLRMW